MQDTQNTQDKHDDDDTLLWGAKAIGQEINRTERDTLYLLAAGKLDAKKCGALWVSTPRKLRQSVLGEGGEAS